MVDKVRPLKYESPSTGGTQTDLFDTEMNPLEDYVSAKGIAFEGLDTFLIEKLGRVIVENSPNFSTRPTYLVGGDIDFIEVFTGFTQTVINRVAKIVLAYASFNVSSETIYIYASDGETVLRTITRNYSYSEGNLANVEVVTT